MFASSRFLMNALAHSLSTPTETLKINAHVEIRLGALTRPYVETCKGGGILPYVGTAVIWNRLGGNNRRDLSLLQTAWAEARTACRNIPRSEVARCSRPARCARPSAAK